MVPRCSCSLLTLPSWLLGRIGVLSRLKVAGSRKTWHELHPSSLCFKPPRNSDPTAASQLRLLSSELKSAEGTTAQSGHLPAPTCWESEASGCSLRRWDSQEGTFPNQRRRVSEVLGSQQTWEAHTALYSGPPSLQFRFLWFQFPSDKRRPGSRWSWLDPLTERLT